MERYVTLSYDWKFGREELAIMVGSYSASKGLYIGLYQVEDGEAELFSDSTVCLPQCPLRINEAYIDHFNIENKLEFIRKHKLGEILPETRVSGRTAYHKVSFDLGLLAELDSEGMRQYLISHGIEMPEKRDGREAKHGRQERGR